MDEVGQLADQVPTVDGREAVAQRAVQPPSMRSVDAGHEAGRG